MGVNPRDNGDRIAIADLFGSSNRQPRNAEMTEPTPQIVAIAKKHENAIYEDPEAKSINDRSGFLLVKTNAPRTAIQQITAVRRRAGKIIHAPIIKK